MMHTRWIYLDFEFILLGFVIQLVFYGFCGSNIEDAIALDDIIIGPDGSLTTTTSSTELTEITSDASTQTTTAPSKAFENSVGKCNRFWLQ